MPTGSIVFLIFTGVVTFAVILQTVILFAVFVAAKQSERRVMELVDRLRQDLAPTLNAAKDVMLLIDEVSPKIKAITNNVHTASERLRGQVNNIDILIAEITGRTRQQVVRIDGMVTETIDGISRGTRIIQDNVLAPIRQIGGWLNTVRAAFDMFTRGEKRSRSQDRDRDFV